MSDQEQSLKSDEAALRAADHASQIAALHRVQAVIEFNLDGTIITANDNFLQAMGYRLDEIQGQHHRMFVTPETKNSATYRAFWEDLSQGEFRSGKYRRLTKHGRDLWLEASYNPIFDPNGKVYKVVKYATDITEAVLRSADYSGQIEAINKAQAVIEFNLDGTIITANENFLKTMGYQLKDIQGKHHRMFVSHEIANSQEYKSFWASLARGEYQAGEYRRLANGRRDIWLQASYNPIFDPDGKPFKVVKYASDITQAKLEAANYQGQLEAIHKVQAVIEFNLDGTIITANDNFLQTMGYSLAEIQGKHHSMFVSPEIKASRAYRDFWDNLGRGQHQSGEFERVDRGGNEIWLQASYNPIYDPDGKPFKVVKYASDITESKQKISDDQKSQATYTNELQHIIGKLECGELGERGNMDILRDDYKEVMAGLNRVVDVIVAPVQELQNQLEQVAQGNLTAYITGEYAGDHAKLKDALNTTLDSLNEILNQVNGTTKKVTIGSNQVSDSSQSVSQGATEQASALEEITASMTQLAAQTRQNADNANEANKLTSTAKDDAEDGSQQMQEMVDAMKQIDESSQNISKIIKVIDEIAFQTNLLALNAAVEAARAGVHGKGFAVVAEEVRNLAARSANAAKETTEMIEESTQKVKMGSAIASKTATALTRIVDGVGKVTHLSAEIASASNEQAQAISQINQALGQMDQVSQQNTANAEESAAASVELSSQAQQLQNLLTRFTLKETRQPEPQEIPPEMMRAFQQFLAHQQATRLNAPGHWN
jgi:methyl-accepting chemotaxis protein